MSVSKKKRKPSKVQRRSLKEDLPLYILFLPAMLYIVVFKLAPMPGVLIAFKDYNIFEGFFASEWVGFQHFIDFFTKPQFSNLLKNTLSISVLKIIFLFPLPIILAIMLNEIRVSSYKKVVQTIIYLPHFLSIVIIHGIFVTILSTQGGIINNIITSFGGSPINFYSNDWFRLVLVITDAYKEVGWGTIVYLAALSGVDVQLYEAAQVDGAGRFRQMINITLPSIVPIIMLMLILRLGNILAAGTEQIIVMYNATVYPTADVLGSYVYRVGIGRAQYGFSTAIGLFESVVSFVLIVGANSFTSKVFKRGLW